MDKLITDLSIKHNNRRMRLTSEFTNLIGQCDSLIYEHDNNGINITIIIKNNIYKLFVSEDYPFKMPTNVYYNGIEFNKYIYDNLLEIKKYLIKYYHIECLCCRSLLCGVNWTPMVNIAKIINEINDVVRIRKEITYRILCDKIRDKYRCYFAELEKYLFI